VGGIRKQAKPGNQKEKHHPKLKGRDHSLRTMENTLTALSMPRGSRTVKESPKERKRKGEIQRSLVGKTTLSIERKKGRNQFKGRRFTHLGKFHAERPKEEQTRKKRGETNL